MKFSYITFSAAGVWTKSYCRSALAESCNTRLAGVTPSPGLMATTAGGRLAFGGPLG